MESTKTYIAPVVGMKVKLIRGDQNDRFYPPFNEKDAPRQNAVNWIAGRIPVGSIGEVYKYDLYPWRKTEDESRYMFALKFPGIEAKAGYCFGLSHDGLNPEVYEVVS